LFVYLASYPRKISTVWRWHTEAYGKAKTSKHHKFFKVFHCSPLRLQDGLASREREALLLSA